MPMDFDNLLARLLSGEGAAWNEFFLNVVAVRHLVPLLDAPRAQELLNQGLQWTGAGITTSAASKKLRDITGVALVSNDFSHYRDCWLFGLAIVFDKDVVSLQLPDKAAEAAYIIVDQIQHNHRQDDQVMEFDDGEESEEKEFKF